MHILAGFNLGKLLCKMEVHLLLCNKVCICLHNFRKDLNVDVAVTVAIATLNLNGIS